VALILVVEDDVALQRVLTRILERAGHTVHVAGDGLAGVKAFREIRPDLVLTDLQMPEANGIEVILMLQAAAPTLPVIAMSGGEISRGLDLLTDARLLGAVGLLPKPFSVAELLSAVNVALLPRSQADAGGATG
jgi:two-component system, OmpR family, response regulator